jgi:hypothetical protein
VKELVTRNRSGRDFSPKPSHLPFTPPGAGYAVFGAMSYLPTYAVILFRSTYLVPGMDASAHSRIRARELSPHLPANDHIPHAYIP